jgi:hypothetical protein
MNTKRLRRLYAGTLAVLVFYVFLLISMAIAIPSSFTLWADKQWADEQIRSAQALEQLQRVAYFAASSIRVAQKISSALLFMFLFVTIGMIVFLGWSWLTIGRLKREDSIDHAA